MAAPNSGKKSHFAGAIFTAPLYACLIGLFGAGLLFTSLAHTAEIVVNADTSLEWNQKEAFYQAIGNAHARQGNRDIFADSLTAHYNADTAEREITNIIAAGNVRFSETSYKGTGTFLDYRALSGTYLLSGPDARLSGPDSRGRAQTSILFERSKGEVSFLGAAEIRLEDGREIMADKIILLLDDGENIDRLRALGQVIIVQSATSMANAEMAYYDKATNIITLNGDVIIMDSGNELRADIAEIDFNTGISRMLGNNDGGRVTGRFTTADQ